MAIIGISGKSGSGKDTVGEMIRSLVEYPNLTYEDYKTDVVEEYVWTIKKFAGKLKQMTALILGCTVRDLENESFKNGELGKDWWYFGFGDLDKDRFLRTSVMVPYNDTDDVVRDDDNQVQYLNKLTPRLILQLLGTQGGRKVIHPDIWVNALFSDYKPLNELVSADKITLDGLSGESLPNWIITDVRFPNEAKRIKILGGINIRMSRDIKTSAGNTHESETALDNYEFDYIINNNNITLEKLYNIVKELLIKIQTHEIS